MGFAVNSLHNINKLELGNKMNAYRIFMPSFTILGSVILFTESKGKSSILFTKFLSVSFPALKYMDIVRF
jgi:hypothetical protein